MVPPFVCRASGSSLGGSFGLGSFSGCKRFGKVFNKPVISRPDHRNFVTQHFFHGLEMKNITLTGQR
jgi:hypothetical protein